MREAAQLPVLVALWRTVVLGLPFRLGRPLRESELAWAIETGMAPLLYVATRGAPELVPGALAARLEVADRLARVQSADALAAVAELLDRCADRTGPLTLLKGLSTCGEYYASPHHRFLGDLDLLVEPADAPAACAALAELGYRAALTGSQPHDHHHLPAVVHPRTRICVELHTRLFPRTEGLDASGPFAPATLRRERRPATLAGRSVLRLSPELQVPYIASHWALDFVPAAGARSLLDTALLLRAETRRLDWARVLAWLDDRRIAAHLQLMLSQLDAAGLVELPPEPRELLARTAVLTPRRLRILGAMVDRYQVRGLMRGAPRLARSGRGEPTPDASVHGTFRSRLATLHTAVATRNLRGLLPIVDSLVWSRLLEGRRSLGNALLVGWSLLLPPGDPDRLVPGRRLRRLAARRRPRASDSALRRRSGW